MQRRKNCEIGTVDGRKHTYAAKHFHKVDEVLNGCSSLLEGIIEPESVCELTLYQPLKLQKKIEPNGFKILHANTYFD